MENVHLVISYLGPCLNNIKRLRSDLSRVQELYVVSLICVISNTNANTNTNPPNTQVRIAVHPDVQRMGYGSRALQQLTEYFEGKLLDIEAVEAAEQETYSNGQRHDDVNGNDDLVTCLLYTSPSPRDRTRSRMPSSA